MDSSQNSPIAQKPTDVSDSDPYNKPLTLQQQLWIDYNALSGLITDLTEEFVSSNGEPATLKKMSITEFAGLLGLDRKTLQNWRREIPNFWDRVNARRRELAPQSRLQRVHETWYLKAVKGEFQHMQLWLANFDSDFKMPQEKVKHEMTGNWMELLQNKKVIEGEVINDPPKPDIAPAV